MKELDRKMPFDRAKNRDNNDILRWLIAGHPKSLNTFKVDDVVAVTIGAM